MLILIPMAGLGDRFVRAGEPRPKPLIEVDGKPMIERVVAGFPGADRFLFVVNRRHAEESDLLPTLRRLAPGADIAVIEPHKDGPGETVLRCADRIPNEEEVILNYCDFGCEWSFREFRDWLVRGEWDGAMTAYRGFHPHSFGPTLYAYMKNEGDRVTAIKEKGHFTADRTSEFASSGLYYFRRGRDLKDLSLALVARGERVHGEFYISMVMERLIERGGRVGVQELRRFFQWGTPEDLRAYNAHARSMRELDSFLGRVSKLRSRAAHVIPMAGQGRRFRDRGYVEPKPWIDVLGAPMIARSAAFLPRPCRRILIALKEHARGSELGQAFASFEERTEIVSIDHRTEGQACTALLGVEKLEPEQPVLIAPCDTGCLFDEDRWSEIEAAPNAEMIVWTAPFHLPAVWRPPMYGFIHCAESDRVTSVGVKKPIDGIPIGSQEVIVGTFYFPRARTFLEEARAMVATDDRIRDEFYIDTIVRRKVVAGETVRAFRVSQYLPWGTPEELDTFRYWNDVFREGRPLP